MSSTPSQIRRIESLIRIDPARRGLLADDDSAAIGVGQLDAAARALATGMREVVIVTGFAVPTSDGFRTETDGPLGAVLLGSVLSRLGAVVSFLTDSVNLGPLREIAQRELDSGTRVLECPVDPLTGPSWCRRFLTDSGPLSHLIAVERVGPSHSVASLSTQMRDGPAPIEEFRRTVAEADQGLCFNMRGEPLDGTTAPLHLLFEQAPELRPDLKTIGVCDGGNEIGMGLFPWESVHPLVNGGQGPRIVCRTRTDWTILAGTSNWGAYGLAAAVALLMDRVDVLEDWTQHRQEQLLEHLVARGPAVDGVTRLQEPTVDGLPFITYIQPWNGIREAVGLGVRGT